MKAIVLSGIREFEIRDIPVPAVKKDTDVLLKIEAAGVCGSDVHYYSRGCIGSDSVQYPFIIGHECAATVKDVGGAVSRVNAGDRVVVEPAISCNVCDQCMAGRKNTCRNLKFLGYPGQVEGCLCEYIVMPEANCFAYSENLTAGQVVLCEPLAIALYAVKQSGLKEDDSCAILGAGPIGLSCLLAAIYKGAGRCFVTEKVDERIKAAESNGAEWVGSPERENIVKEILKRSPEGLDVVFECAGQQETIDEAIEILKPGGKMMIIGIPETESVSFPIHRMRRKEISIVNVRRQNNCTQAAIDLIAKGSIDVDFMLTHRFRPEQAAKAFDMAASYRDGVIKAVIEF